MMMMMMMMMIGATTRWNPRDASPPTLEIIGTKCIWSPSATFATGCHLPLGTLGNLQYIASPDILAKYKGRSEKARRVEKGTGETWVEQ